MTHPIAVTYRPDIDGLRAVAVLAVVGYHASPSLVPGGFIGVDIFFVISGFLISSIILREIEGGTFSLVAFYGRRIRRLFPALIAMLIVTFVLGWYSLLPHEFQTLGKHITAGAAYFINITLKKEAGYFDTSGDMKPLLHLWSLAIEEQFYLIWPLLLLAVAKQRRAFAVIAIVMVASFISSIVVLGRKDAFYLPNNRMWELASGAMLALAVLRLADRQQLSQTLSRFAERFGGARTRDLASCAGLAIILVSLFGLDRTLTYPGYWVLLPCAGALLLISAGESALLNRWLLSHPVLVFIGLISYPFYLWHWPLLSYATITGYGTNPVVRFAMVSLAAVLAVLTYLYIERPVRHRKSNVVPISLFGITLAFCVAGTLAQKDVFHARLNGPEHRAISAAVNDWAFPNGLSRTKLPSGLIIHRTAEGDGTVLYAGDSNVEQYWPRIHRLLDQSQKKRPVIFATTGGCPAIPGFRRRSNGGCTKFGERVLELAKDHQVQTVILGGDWTEYFSSDNYYILGHPGTTPEEFSASRNDLVAALADVVRTLRQQGKTVWVILTIPTGSGLSPLAKFKRSLLGNAEFGATSLDRRVFETSWAPIRAKIVSAVQAAGATIIDPMDWLCDAKICPGTASDGQLMYKDGNHLSASYVRDHATFIDQTYLGGGGEVAR